MTTPPPSIAAPIVQPLVDSGLIAGALTLAVTRDGAETLETFGMADIAAARPISADDLFWIASTSKAISGVIIAMLVDEGLIDPSAPVEKYLPEFKGQMLAVERDEAHVLLRPPHRPITVRETLCHVSGLPFKSAAESPTLDALPMRIAARTYAMMALDFEPGAKYQYSNAGTNTAATIAEVVTGQPFEQLLQERLFDPLGMVDTTFWPSQEQLDRLAKPYRLSGTDDEPGTLEEIANEFMQYHFPLNDRVRRFPFPAGGLFSTARDCGRFARMIANGGALEGHCYLTPKALADLTAKHTPDNLTEHYGYGWNTADVYQGHGGAYRNNLLVSQKTGVSTVFMVQSAGAGDRQVKAAIHAFRAAADARLG